MTKQIPQNITISAEQLIAIGTLRLNGHRAAEQKAKLRQASREQREAAAKARGAKGGSRSGPHVVGMTRLRHTKAGPVAVHIFLGKADEAGNRRLAYTIEDAVVFDGARQAEQMARIAGPEWGVVRQSDVRPTMNPHYNHGWNTWARLSDSDLSRGAELGLI